MPSLEPTPLIHPVILPVLEHTTTTETLKAGAVDASQPPAHGWLDTDNGAPVAASPDYRKSPGVAQGPPLTSIFHVTCTCVWKAT